MGIGGVGEYEIDSMVDPSPRAWRRCAAAWLLGCLALAGCGSANEGADGVDPIYYESAGAFPFDSLSDWVSYATQVSVIRVVSEEAVDVPTQESEPERSIGRRVAVDVQETLWSRAQPANQLSFNVNDGWLERDGERIPLAPAQGSRLEVGRTYIAALVEEAGQWGVLTEGSVLPMEGGRIRLGDRFDPAAEDFEEMTPGALKSAIARARPHPLAERYRNLPPTERAIRVAEESPALGDSPN